MKKQYLAVAFCALLAGCAETPDEYKKVEAACSNFGGLKYHYLFPWEQVHCNDGTVFKTLAR